MIIDNNYSTGDILPASWVVDVANEINSHTSSIGTIGNYLPLTGGEIKGTLNINHKGKQAEPSLSFNTGANGIMGFYSAYDDRLRVTVGGLAQVDFHDGLFETIYDARVRGDLQVDGTITTGPGKPLYLDGNWGGGRIYSTGDAGREYMVFGNANSGAQINMYGMGDSTGAGNILFYAGEAEGGGMRTVGRWDGPSGAFIAYRNVEVRGQIQADKGTEVYPGIAFRGTDGYGNGFRMPNPGIIEMRLFSNSTSSRGLYIGNSKQGTKAGFWSPPIGDSARNTTANPNVVWSGSGGLLSVNSSKRAAMSVIEGVERQYSTRLHDLEPVWFRSALNEDSTRSQYGLVAEDVAKIDPRLATWETTYKEDDDGNRELDDDGNEIVDEVRPLGVDYSQITALLLSEVKDLRQRVAELEAA